VTIEKEGKMNTYRKNAIIVGASLIACSAATILSATLLGPILDVPDYLTKLTKNETVVIIAALIEFIQAATAMGIAIGLYPLLKKYHEALALGSVGFRIVEGVIVLVATFGLLSLLTLSKEFVQAGDPDVSSFHIVGSSLLAIRYWAHNVIVLITFELGALLYYYILYQSKLIPRWLSGWGFLAAAMSLVVTLFSAFNSDFALSWTNNLLNAPIAVQEMVFAVWLIARGFNLRVLTSRLGNTQA
jgi:hypothetical protein